MIEKSPLNSIIILGIVLVAGILTFALARIAWGITQEEIFYWYGVKATGDPRVYDAVRKENGVYVFHPDSPFRTMEECRSQAEGYSCRFTLQHTFESVEEMNRRFNEFMLMRGLTG